MFEVVKLPEKAMIDQWDNLEKPPIVETVPRSVPLPTFVKYPSEGDYQHILSGRFKLFAHETEEFIDLVNFTIHDIESLLSKLYTRRGVSMPLYNYIEGIKKERNITTTPPEFLTPEASNMAKDILKPIHRLLKFQRDSCTAIPVQIKGFFAVDFWKEGRYNDDFLDHLCMLFLRATSLEQLGPNKNCLINDIANLKKLVQDPKMITEIGELQIWFTNPQSLSQMILDGLSDLKPEDVTLIFDIIFNHIKKNTDRPTFINPEIQFAYRVTFIFIIQFYEKIRQIEIETCSKNKKHKPKMKELGKSVHEFYEYLISVYPLTPLFLEISQETNSRIPASFFGKSGPKPIESRDPSLPTQQKLDTLRQHFNDLSALVGFFKSNEAVTKDKVYEKAPEVTNLLQTILHSVAENLNSVRTFLVFKLTKPPAAKEGDKRTNFERSMKDLTEGDLNMLLLILRICRSLRELIEDNLPILQECCWAHIMNQVQLFVYDTLGEIHKNSGKKDKLEQIIATLRAIAGNFTAEAFKYDERHDKKKQPPRPPSPTTTLNCGTLELLRHKLQAMTNPESVFISRSKLLNSSEVKEINAFLDLSRHYSELMQLNETIDIVFDQSNLYFKEYFLSVYNVTFFPVTTSLPVILCDHALKNKNRTDLTSAIFYPLSIYDDAASFSLRFLHSKHLYEEIKAEASICLLSVTNMISDAIFNPLRIFASLRLMNLNSYRHVKTQIQDNTHALRMGVILQQNQLFVLGCFIDTKSLLSDRLNNIFYEQLLIATRNIEKYGALASIAFSKLVQMLRGTHELLVNFDLPLMPFDDILSRSLRNDTPNSLQSKIMFDVLEHIENHISDFYAVSYPLSLIPRYLNDPKIEVTGNANGPLDQIMHRYLKDSVMVMSIESFRELFKYMDNGTIAILHQQILGILDESFASLLEVYQSVEEKLKRIRLGNPSLSSSQIYDRFEGAYNLFHDDLEVLSILNDLTAIGNILAISEIMDNAFLLKKETMLQNQAFIFSQECLLGTFSDEEEKKLYFTGSPENSQRMKNWKNPEFFEMFDKDFQQTKPILYKDLENGIIPSHNDCLPLFLYNALKRLFDLINRSSVFNENSNNILDPRTMTGFSSVWIIIEFLFCLIEMLKNNKEQKSSQPGALAVYGESPLLAASAFILLTGQKNLYNVHNIGKKIRSTAETELSFTDTSNVGKFCKVFKLIDASMRCSFTNYQTITDAIIASNK